MPTTPFFTLIFPFFSLIPSTAISSKNCCKYWIAHFISTGGRGEWWGMCDSKWQKAQREPTISSCDRFGTMGQLPSSVSFPDGAFLNADNSPIKRYLGKAFHWKKGTALEFANKQNTKDVREDVQGKGP